MGRAMPSSTSKQIFKMRKGTSPVLFNCFAISSSVKLRLIALSTAVSPSTLTVIAPSFMHSTVSAVVFLRQVPAVQEYLA